MILAPLAFLAGLLSFLSPCVLPLVPSYLSFLMDSSLMNKEWSKSIRSILIVRSLGFITGFTLVFIVLSVVFAFGLSFIPIRVMNILSGSIIVLLALHILFNIFPFLNYDKRSHNKAPPTSFFTALPIGMAFSAGWSPCIGPILASILLLAAQEGSLLWAIVLLFLYSFGLAIPFFLFSFFYPRVRAFVHRSQKYTVTFKIITGCILLIFGVVILLERMQFLNALLFRMAQQVFAFYTAYQSTIAILLTLIYATGVILTLFFVKKRRLYIKIGIIITLITLIVLELYFSVSIFHGLSWYLRFQGI